MVMEFEMYLGNNCGSMNCDLVPQVIRVVGSPGLGVRGHRPPVQKDHDDTNETSPCYESVQVIGSFVET